MGRRRDESGRQEREQSLISTVTHLELLVSLVLVPDIPDSYITFAHLLICLINLIIRLSFSSLSIHTGKNSAPYIQFLNFSILVTILKTPVSFRAAS